MASTETGSTGVAMKSETAQKHPLAIAWEEWLASDEGQQCRAANTLAHNTNHYLENRLWRAFTAGAKLSPSDAEQLIQLRKAATSAIRLIDGGYGSMAASQLRAALNPDLQKETQ